MAASRYLPPELAGMVAEETLVAEEGILPRWRRRVPGLTMDLCQTPTSP